MNAAILPVQPHVTPRRAGSTRLQLRGTGMVRAAAFVDVRQSGDEHDALLTVVVPLFSGSRTLSRPAGEPLSKALARLRAALAPPPKRLSRADKKARSSSAGAPAGRVDADPVESVYVAVLDGAGVALDEEAVSNAQAWVPGHVLAVDTHRYPVRLNVPLISHLRLAFDVPCVGYPLLPTPVGLQFCTPDTVAWRWTRHVKGGSDVTVCTTQRYVPVDQDIGCVLSCTCTLPLLDTPSAPGARWEAATARAVTQQVLPRRDRGAALQRLAALGSPRRSAGSVRIMSYNVLADAYAHTWGRLYPYLQPQHSGPGYRLPAALHDVAAAGADVVCLQEVDLKWFDRFWLPQLTALGYTCSHTPKNSTAGEGCALCVRSDRYSVAALRHVDLRAGALPGLPTPPSALAPLLGAHPAMLTALGRVNTVAQLAVLLPVKQSGDMVAAPPLLVANTHLFFHPGAPHIRILQADALLRAAAGMRQEWDAAAALSLVVCGDLNAEPHDGAVEYLTAGHVDADHQDWDACASFTFEPPLEAGAIYRGAPPSQSHHVAPSQPLPRGFDLPRDAAGFGCAADGGGAALSHPFGPLQSGCGQQGFTNYVGGFVAVLDYILHDATLVSVAAAPVPSVEDVTRQTALPNAQFPSDHVPQVCDLIAI